MKDQRATEKPIKFDVFVLPKGTTANDLFDKLNASVSQLAAMLATIYGAGFESFKDYNEITQDAYLWSCAEKARECEMLLDALGPIIYNPRPANEL